MSLTFKDYKINHIALFFIKVLTLSQKQVKIQKFSAFDRSNLLLDRSKNEEIHHYASASFDWFSIPVRSIEINIWLIERNSWSIETLITEFFQNFLGIVFDIFIAFFHQKHLLILSTKIYRSNIKVFNIKIKNHNNARNLENISLITLGINFIKVF